MKRLRDQVLVLRAIGEVREELRVAEIQGADGAKLYSILGRLVSLYAVLNVGQLEQVAMDSDCREFHREAA